MEDQKFYEQYMLQHKYCFQPIPDEEEDPFFDLPRLVDLEEIDDETLVLMVEAEIAIVSSYSVNLTALKLSESSVCRNSLLVTKTSLDNTFITACLLCQKDVTKVLSSDILVTRASFGTQRNQTVLRLLNSLSSY